MILAKVNTRGQITIPSEIRESLGPEPGDRVLFLEGEGQIILRPVTLTVLDLSGSVNPSGRSKSFDSVRIDTKRAISKKLVGG